MTIAPLLLACALSSSPAPTPPTTPPPAAETPADPKPETSEHLLATLRSHPLAYTRHARCRMGCRDVTESEVQGLLQHGEWIPERTRDDGRCPSHAIEGTGDGGQRLRVVFAACADETRVVTTIDLGREWPCECD